MAPHNFCQLHMYCIDSVYIPIAEAEESNVEELEAETDYVEELEAEERAKVSIIVLNVQRQMDHSSISH